MRKIYQLMILVMMGLAPVFTSCDEITALEDNPVPTTPATDDATQAGDKDDEGGSQKDDEGGSQKDDDATEDVDINSDPVDQSDAQARG